MPKKDDNKWIDPQDLPSFGRVYGGLVKLPDDTILRVYIQLGDIDAELVEATVAVVTVDESSILKRKELSFPGEPLSTKELAQKITVENREISIRQYICETIIPYYKRR